MEKRQISTTRKTKETDIQVTLNLDGSGYAKVDTGIGFFDHMLISFAKHGFFDLNCKVTGDLFVDSTIQSRIPESCLDRRLQRRSVISRESSGLVLSCFRWMRHWCFPH